MRVPEDGRGRIQGGGARRGVVEGLSGRQRGSRGEDFHSVPTLGDRRRWDQEKPASEQGQLNFIFSCDM